MVSMIITYLSLIAVEKLAFITPPKDVTLTETGVTVTFEAEVNKQGTKADWFRGVKQLRRDERIHFKTEGGKHRLIIDDAEPSDVGVYSIEVENLTAKAQLNINRKFHTVVKFY